MGFYGKGLGIASDADLPPGVSQSGFGTRMYVADQFRYNNVVGLGGKATDGTDLTAVAAGSPTEAEIGAILNSYYQQEYEGVNFGVIQNATPIVPNRIRADRTPIPNERGRVDVSGGISMQGNIDVLLPFWKHAFMEVGDGGIYLLNTEADASKFNARSEIDAQYQYAWTPGYTTKRYNHASNAPATYPASAAAELIGIRTAAVPSTAFHASDGSRRTVHPDAGSQPNETGGTRTATNGEIIPGDNSPLRLEITLGGTPTVATGRTPKVRIVGKDQNGTILSEEHTFETTGATDNTLKNKIGAIGDYKVRSRYHYTELLTGDSGGVQITGIAGLTATVQIQGRNFKKVTRFTPRTNLTDGMSLYIIKGGIPMPYDDMPTEQQDILNAIYKSEVNARAACEQGGIPNVYAGCMINTMTFSFGETITMDLEFIGRNGYSRVTPAMIENYGRNFGKLHVPPDAASGSTGATAWDFAGAQNETYLGWEGGIQVRELGSTTWETVPCTDLGVSVNNNLTHPERYWFRRWHVKPIPSDQMELMIDATVDAKTAQGYDFLQQANLDLEARAIAFYRTTGGDEFFTKVDMGRVQINQAVDPSVGGPDIITQTFNLKASSKDKNSGDIYEKHPLIVDVCCHKQLEDLR